MYFDWIVNQFLLLDKRPARWHSADHDHTGLPLMARSLDRSNSLFRKAVGRLPLGVASNFGHDRAARAGGAAS